MEILVVAALLGVATGWIAQSKGRSFFGWFALGALLPIVGLIMVIAVSSVEQNIDTRQLASGNRKRCPHCAELIRPEASVCRFCGRDLDAFETATVRTATRTVRILDPDTVASMKASEIEEHAG